MREPVLDSLWAGGQLFFLKSFASTIPNSIAGANKITAPTHNTPPAIISGQNMYISAILIINPIILPNIFNILVTSFLIKNNLSPAYKNVYFTRKR